MTKAQWYFHAMPKVKFSNVYTFEDLTRTEENNLKMIHLMLFFFNFSKLRQWCEIYSDPAVYSVKRRKTRIWLKEYYVI